MVPAGSGSGWGLSSAGARCQALHPDHHRRHVRVHHDTEAITAEAALDGLYVIRTTVGSEEMNPAKVVATYTSLSRVERDFRFIKSIDLDLRPIHHWTETRLRAQAFICMLAAYLIRRLRQAWAPLTFTHENRPEPIRPVAYAQMRVLEKQHLTRHHFHPEWNYSLSPAAQP